MKNDDTQAQRDEALRRDAERYRWLIKNCVNTSRDYGGEVVGYFLYFKDTELLESIDDAIDRHIRASGKK